MTSPQFWISVLTLAGIYAAVTMVLNVEAGWGGMWDLGVVGLMAVGAYTYGIVTANDPGLTTRFQPGWPIWAGILASMAMTGLVAFLIGLPALRLRREYFLITTFAFAEVFRQLAVIQGDITNGTVGFNRLARPFESVVSGTDYNYLLLGIVTVIVLLIFLLTRAISNSAYGRALRSMRDNEPVVLSVGIGVTRLRLQTFVMAGIIFGAIAPVYLWWTRSLVPQLFIPAFTFTAWTALVIGGMGSRLGPLIGAIFLISFTEAVQTDRCTPGTNQASCRRPAGGNWPLAYSGLTAAPRRPHLREKHIRVQGTNRDGLMSALLSASGIRKSFGGILALDDVNVEVHADRITALIGPNGAGKTTLFNVLTGFDRASQGTITFDGQRTERLPPWRLARMGVIRSFQTPVGFPTMTVWENLVVAGSDTWSNTPFAAIFGRSKGKAQEQALTERAVELLDDLGLSNLMDTRIGELSAGDRKLVEFARQLMCEPRLLLLDEPAAGVTPDHMNRLSDIIRRIHNKGIAILVIDHNLSFVLGIADYVYVLSHGRLISEGPPDEVSSDPTVRQIYLGTS